MTETTPVPPAPPGAGAEKGEEHGHRRPFHLGVLAHIRGYFLAGLLVTIPIAVTIYIAWAFINFVDNIISVVIPAPYHPENYLPFAVPGLGLVTMFVGMTVIGWLAAGFAGRFVLRIGERIVARMPVVRSVYGAVKQITETVLAQKSQAFREVVLFEYPRRGTWALGFITGVTKGEVQNLTADEVLNVFLPTTPNPTSGYLLFVPRREVIFLDMTVEEGIKMVVSGGIVTPPDRRPEPARRIPRTSAGMRILPVKPEAEREER